jgi:hypothetical protein
LSITKPEPSACWAGCSVFGGRDLAHRDGVGAVERPGRVGDADRRAAAQQGGRDQRAGGDQQRFSGHAPVLAASR